MSLSRAVLNGIQACIASSLTRPLWKHAYTLRGSRSVALKSEAYMPASRRNTSSTREAATHTRSLAARLRNAFLAVSVGTSIVLGYLYITDTRAGIHQWIVVPTLRWFYTDAEEAHKAGTRALKALYDFGIHPRERGNLDQADDVPVEVFGHSLQNAIGTSAGIDKHAEIPTALLALGPAIVEVGGATPYPQDGNPKPRVWRLPSQKAFINRYGLNSEGADAMAMRLRQRVREYAYSMGLGIDEKAEQMILDGRAGVPPGSLVNGKLLAIQIAKNSLTPENDIEAIKQDYVYCVDALARYADIIVVNVSSPNTSGLRDLQRVGPLTYILTAVVKAAKRSDKKTSPAVMVKKSKSKASATQYGKQTWIIIVGNTTKRRHDLIPAGRTLPLKEAAILLEQGGYSGPRLFERTVSLVKRYRRLLDEGIPDYHPKLPESAVTPQTSQSTTDLLSYEKPTESVTATVRRDLPSLEKSKSNSNGDNADSQSQPLLHLPVRNESSSTSTDAVQEPPAPSSSSHIDQLPRSVRATTGSILPSSKPPSLLTALPGFSLKKSSPAPQSSLTPSSSRHQKVIFASGGITNGKQALEVLDAGASIAQIYTALIYSGVGTISRIKKEMREEIKARK
ncbi:Dihydroorotate dehydrogenase (quinone), mitochondrial [Lambiella insularis]|nr:Dihydroorotate dehydrogenase (quinone), mitochondrial [Lambiella insularis]